MELGDSQNEPPTSMVRKAGSGSEPVGLAFRRVAKKQNDAVETIAPMAKQMIALFMGTTVFPEG